MDTGGNFKKTSTSLEMSWTEYYERGVFTIVSLLLRSFVVVPQFLIFTCLIIAFPLKEPLNYLRDSFHLVVLSVKQAQRRIPLLVLSSWVGLVAVIAFSIFTLRGWGSQGSRSAEISIWVLILA